MSLVRRPNEQGRARFGCPRVLRAGSFSNHPGRGNHMRSLTVSFVLLVVLTEPGLLARAQGTETAGKADGSASVAATKEEVSQLRSEVAAQRQTIEELKALVEKLAEGQNRATGNGAIQIRPATDAA